MKCGQNGVHCNEGRAGNVDLEMQFQSLRYVAGFVAHNFLYKFPNLGERTHEAVNLELGVPDWIRAVSRGGLVVPSDNFMKLVQQFERCFLNFAGASGLHTCFDSITKFKDLLLDKCDCSSVDESVVSLYARTRCFIRLRFMNRQRESVRLTRKDMKKVATVL
jgi:hypothetical protein